MIKRGDIPKFCILCNSKIKWELSNTMYHCAFDCAAYCGFRGTIYNVNNDNYIQFNMKNPEYTMNYNFKSNKIEFYFSAGQIKINLPLNKNWKEFETDKENLLKKALIMSNFT